MYPQTSYDIYTTSMMKYDTMYIYNNIYTFIDTEYSPMYASLCDDDRQQLTESVHFVFPCDIQTPPKM
jgi:hypothetical protein